MQKNINSSGFSILMAIGTIAVLLLLVSSLALTYIREYKITRFSYNDVLASTNAEWAFEYGMLKAKNHKDGFQDTVTNTEPDGKILELLTPRSKWVKTEYSIIASSKDKTFVIENFQHLIIPLFVSNEWIMSPWWVQSKNPSYQTGSINTSNLSIVGVWDLAWSITAMSGSETISITGSGDINTTKTGIIRIQTNQCYSQVDGSIKDCKFFVPGDDEILYSYDETMKISDFLSTKIDPYYTLYNSTPWSKSITISWSSPFSLPTMVLTAKSKKWDSSQIFQFTEDKWKFYDALKYGIYNTGP